MQQVKEWLSSRVQGDTGRNLTTAYRYVMQSPRVAYVSTTIALAIILLTGSTFQPTAYTLFLGAIILSAYHGGVLCGFLSLVLSTFFLACLQYTVPPGQSFTAIDTAASVILLSLAGLLACFLANECRVVARKMDEQCRNLLHTKEGLIVLDEMLRVKHINQAAQELTGWTERDALHRSLESVAGLNEQQSGHALRVPWANLLAAAPDPTGDKKFTGTALLVTRDGQERYVEYWVQVVANAENGKDACFFFRDISDRRENEERTQRSLEQHQRTADAIPTPFFFLDAANRCTLQNKAWQDFAGTAADDKFVQTVGAKLNPTDIQFAANWSKAIRERTKYVTDCQVRNGVNPTRHYRFESVPVRGERGENLGQLCMLHDMTSSKQSEAELLKKQQELVNLQKLLHQCETEANEQIVGLEKAHEVLQQQLTREQTKSADLQQELNQLRLHPQVDAKKLEDQEKLTRARIDKLNTELQTAKIATTRACQVLELVQANLRTGIICWQKGRQKPIIDKNACTMLELADPAKFTGHWSDHLQVLDPKGEVLLDDQATPFGLAEQKKAFRDFEVKVRTQRGTTLSLRASGSPLSDGQGFVVVLRDVTEQVRTLDDVATKTRQVQEAQAALTQERSLVQRQSERINELTVTCADLEAKLARQPKQVPTTPPPAAPKPVKTPRLPVTLDLEPAILDRAVGFARCVAEQMRDLSGQLCQQAERGQAEDFRKKCKTRLLQLNVLAESLRSTLHVPEKSTQQMEPIEISQVVNHVVSTWKRLLHAGTRQLVVSLPSKPAWIVGSGELLGLAMEILVDIACHSSAPGDYIDLSLAKEEDNLVLSITDKGRGFSSQEIGYLRDGIALEKTPDVGLKALRTGVAFVTSLAELHHGDLSVESAGRGKGTAFRLRLPRHVESTTPQRFATEVEADYRVGVPAGSHFAAEQR